MIRECTEVTEDDMRPVGPFLNLQEVEHIVWLFSSTENSMTVLDPTSLRYSGQAVAVVYILIAGEEHYLLEEFFFYKILFA